MTAKPLVVFIVQRTAWAVCVIVAVVTLTFIINRALPSDPAAMVAGPQARPAEVARIREQLGLNQPLIRQYTLFLKRLIHVGPTHFAPDNNFAHASCGHIYFVHIDLGRSYQMRKPVVEILKKHIPYTTSLAIVSIAFATCIGVGLGVIAAHHRNRWLDTMVLILALLGVCVPTFLLGVILQYVFAYQLGWLPLNGAGKSVFEQIRHSVLPSLTLGLFSAAYYVRMTRHELVETLSLDHVRTAQAKGLPQWRVVWSHVLRNIWAPIVTMIGLDFGLFLGGAVITEQIFSWPGLGSLAVRAMRDRDGPVIVGTVLVGATAVTFVNLCVDVAYRFLDPRMQKTK